MEIMSFILEYWWVWIITMVVSLILISTRLLKRIEILLGERDVDTVQKGAFKGLKGLGSMIFFYIIFLISAVLLVINIFVMVLRAV